MQDNQRQALTRDDFLPYCAGLIDGDGSILLAKNQWESNRHSSKVSYISGLMDAEGSFLVLKCDLPNVLAGFKRKNPIYHGKIRIGMVQKKPLEKLNEVFSGGRILCEGVRKGRPTYQIMHRWELCKKEFVKSALKEMIPFLIAKKEQALILLDFLEKWKNPVNRKLGIDPEELQRREEAYQKMRKLNAVGAAATTNSRSSGDAEVIV
jgi:hypothetical protein